MEIFLNNKYTHVYLALIKRAGERTLEGYAETHHIIPKSLGGGNTKSNLVRLTAREHLLCHRLLVRMVDGEAKRKMSYALHCLVNMRNPHMQSVRVTSRVFAAAREANSQAMSGRVVREDTRAKMSKASKSRGISAACREAAIRTSKGRIRTPEEREATSRRFKGRAVTEEHRQKIASALRGRQRPPHVIEKMKENTWKKGRTPHNKGVPRTKEQNERLSKTKLAAAIRYEAYHNGTNFVGVYNIKEFCTTYNYKYYNAYSSIKDRNAYLTWTFKEVTS